MEPAPQLQHDRRSLADRGVRVAQHQPGGGKAHPAPPARNVQAEDTRGAAERRAAGQRGV